MVELTYTGDEPFHDTERNHIYHASTHDVPADAAEEYLAHDGWARNRPDDADGDDTDTEADADTEVESDDDLFDAVGFLDDDWRDVVARIEGGEADGHLDTLKAKEEARTIGDGARSSVLAAIETRRDDDSTGNADNAE